MKRILGLIVITALLAGCNSTAPVKQETPILHPTWPDQIRPWTGKWQVKVIDGQAWVGMPFEESQNFRGWLNDVMRYVKDANGTICYYRHDLKEPKCGPANRIDSSSVSVQSN